MPRAISRFARLLVGSLALAQAAPAAALLVPGRRSSRQAAAAPVLAAEAA